MGCAVDLARLFVGTISMFVFTLWMLTPDIVTRVMEEIRVSFRTQEAHELIAEPFHLILTHVGAPPPYPSATSIALIIVSTLSAFIIMIAFLGNTTSADQRRVQLEQDLRKTQKRLKHLEWEMNQLTIEEQRPRTGKPVRIFMEGAFDIMHYGHMNAFRLGASLFDNTELIVGVNSDETIKQCKGPPVMSDDERCTAVEGCRFVQQVVPRTPYVMTEKYLSQIMEEYDIDYVVHGDDPCIVDGKDVYGHVKALGKYMSIPRTEGVSTTDIVGRMLLVSKVHHKAMSDDSSRGLVSSISGLDSRQIEDAFASKFVSTTNLLRYFSVGCTKYDSSQHEVIYLDGAWDMFHSGHIDIIKAARKLSTKPYIIIGVQSDELVNQHRGLNYPIMNLQERLLSVLGCKYVDDVVIDAPWKVSAEMIKSLEIKMVVHGTNGDDTYERGDPYEVARELGIYTRIKSPRALSVYEIVRRINDNKDRFLNKFLNKMAKEKEYYDNRYAAPGNGGK